MKGNNSVNATVEAPEVSKNADFVFQVTITDDKGASATYTLTILAEAKAGTTQPENNEPVAVLNAPEEVNAGAIVSLDASLSSDADKDALTFTWTSPAGIELTASGDLASFVAGTYTEDTRLTFSVKVSDGELFNTASVTVLVKKTVSEPSCDNAWKKTEVYTSGNRATHQGVEYEAKWRTTNEEPGTTGEWGVWKIIGAATCQ